MPIFCFTGPGAPAVVDAPPDGAAEVGVSAVLDDAERTCAFTWHGSGMLAAPLSLWLGGVCIARPGPDSPEGRIEVPMSELFALDQLDLSAQGLEALAAPLAVRAEGNLFVIPTLRDEEGIARHIQHRPTRFRERKLLRLAAKHVYNSRQDDFILRAMSMVILGYRLLDSPKARYNAQDRAELDWIVGECITLQQAGAAMLADRAKADWRVYRWTLSVAKMAGYLAISIEDYALASSFFGFANAHWEWVETIPASGANIATMTCLNGMLLLMLGEREAGIASLSLCVARMSWFIAQQHLYLSVSSYSESKEIVRTGCQAFTLLALAGGLPAGGRRPQLHNRRFDLGEVWPFLVHRMILGGRCGRLKAFLLESGLAHEADLTPPPRKPAAG